MAVFPTIETEWIATLDAMDKLSYPFSSIHNGILSVE